MMDNHLTFIDLFAGIGGIRKGFESEDFKCVFSSENDIHAKTMYQQNYHEEPAGDITKIKAKDIPDHHIMLAGLESVLIVLKFSLIIYSYYI